MLLLSRNLRWSIFHVHISSPASQYIAKLRRQTLTALIPENVVDEPTALLLLFEAEQRWILGQWSRLPQDSASVLRLLTKTTEGKFGALVWYKRL
jgi:hypothetical protein